MRFVSWLALSLAVISAPVLAADINVGPGRIHKTLAAAAAAKAGDRILLDAGTYTDNAATIAVPLTIEGQGSGATWPMSALLPDHKGNLITQAGTMVRNLTFDSALASADDGNNGAGIRAEGGNLTADNCTFLNNQDGIPGAVVTVSNSIFNGSGADDGCSHGPPAQ